MQTNDVSTFLNQISEERKEVFNRLRQTILDHIPSGFQEEMSYGMLGYVVPHTVYPAGYHCDPKLPLPFISIASQKNFIALYHMGIYAKPELLEWFQAAYSTHVKGKLDMGKSCIRFKKMDQIPFDLIGELVQKMTVEDWIQTYELNYRSSKK